MNKTRQTERYYEIDFFRFLAAMSVVLYHYTFRGYAGDKIPVSFPQMAHVFKYGHLGVDFFFMISGFVILLTALNKDFKGFAISRIARLYPAFWVSVSITTIAIVFIGGDRFSVGLNQYLVNLTMVSRCFGVDPVDGVYWTLFVEIRFYLLISLLILLNQTSKIKLFLILWLMISIAAPHIKLPSVVQAVLITKWASYFIAGAAFYLIRKEGISTIKTGIVVASFFLSVYYSFLRVPEHESIYQVTFSYGVVFGIIAIFYLTMFLIATNKLGILNKKQMVTLGVVTYPLYLIHQNVGFMLFNYFGQSIEKHVLLLLVISAMIAGAYVIHKYMEIPLSKKLKDALVLLTERQVQQVTAEEKCL